MENAPFLARPLLSGLIAAVAVVLSLSTGAAAAEGGAPTTAPAHEHVAVRLRANDLRQGLRLASASVGSEKAAGLDFDRVLLEATAASATLVSTDGRRLMAVEMPGLDPGKSAGPAVATTLSMNAVRMALEALDGLDGDVAVDVSPDRLAIAQGKVELRVPTAKAKFPDWRKVVPKADDGVAVTVNAGRFLQSVAEAKAGGNPPRATMVLSRNKLVVTGLFADGFPEGPELAVAYDGDERKLSFNVAYLRSFLEVLDKGKAVKMVLHGPRDAILFVTDDGCRYVLMPIAVGG